MMPVHPGTFVWYELMTTDTYAAAEFYKSVVGWGVEDCGLHDVKYTVFTAAGTPMGGMLALPQDVLKAGGCPGWIGYIAVDDVDASTQRVKAAGGSIHREAADIPTIGRFAVVSDPQGAVFTLFKGASDEEPQRPPHGTPGHAGWNELHAADWEGAFEFYSDLFGWTKGDAIDMGGMGIYQLFSTADGQVGGMMSKTESTPGPSWVYYFTVDSIETGAERVKEAGGHVQHGPQEVPGGRWIVQCLDPQGVMFALVGPHAA